MINCSVQNILVRIVAFKCRWANHDHDVAVSGLILELTSVRASLRATVFEEFFTNYNDRIISVKKEGIHLKALQWEKQKKIDR